MTTLWVDGTVKGYVVRIFIDTRSSHNFMDERLVERMGLTPEPILVSNVMIGHGMPFEQIVYVDG